MSGNSRAFKSIRAISHSRKLMVLVPNACYTVGRSERGWAAPSLTLQPRWQQRWSRRGEELGCAAAVGLQAGASVAWRFCCSLLHSYAAQCFCSAKVSGMLWSQPALCTAPLSMHASVQRMCPARSPYWSNAVDATSVIPSVQYARHAQQHLQQGTCYKKITCCCALDLMRRCSDLLMQAADQCAICSVIIMTGPTKPCVLLPKQLASSPHSKKELRSRYTCPIYPNCIQISTRNAATQTPTAEQHRPA